MCEKNGIKFYQCRFAMLLYLRRL